uniref:Zinc finger protein 771-like n=1 Tax=Oncorhynchus kisutch TaxID=8019 RepID=A0A8C7C934_ONCKI
MSKLQLLNVILKEKLTTVPLEISVAVQKTMADLTEEEINPEQQEWNPGLGPVESDAEESIWDSFKIITEENQTESDGESYGESELTSDYEPPSEVNADSDNSGSHKGKRDGVEKRISLSGLNLKRHRQSRHSKDRPYMCDTCGHCFAMNCSLRRHMKIHMEERQHGCTECSKRFFHKKSLKNHMDTHKGLVFKCDFCGKCVTTKASLKLHRRIHTGEKSHPCKECDKAFYRESDLIKHTRTHTGEKPFRCKECARCFVEKGTLTKHMMTHTEEKPHRCNKCGRCFGLKGNLTVHMRTHTGEGVQCHMCGTHLKLASRSVLTPLVLRCSALDRCTTREPYNDAFKVLYSSRINGYF